MVTLTLLGALVVASVIALLVFRGESRTAQQTARHRHAVTATTTGPAQSDGFRTGGGRARAPATWNVPRAVAGSGLIVVPAGTTSGTAVPIQVDDGGRPAAPAEDRQAITSDAVAAGLGTATGLSAVAAGAYALRRRTLGRRAEMSWEPEWEQVEPLWSGRS
ncbi:hypothetical protein OH807_38460 [Kitasatospora sp. NBC_01560]|uniref:Rv1733c family protein n=1 Tax=Kitasatospora sp. NBC_01560 TaxID=2975965 RepID=UPI00386AB201